MLAGMTEDAGERNETVAVDEAVRAMVAEHGPAIYRVAVSIVRDAALAEDVVQETLLRAWRGRDTYRGDAPLRHWLLRIAHNVAVSTLRSLREETHDPQSLPEQHAAGAESVVENRIAIDEALARLDKLSRAIVVLREVEGLTYTEIGEVLGLPLPTVKTRLFRARLALRKMTEGGRP